MAKPKFETDHARCQVNVSHCLGKETRCPHPATACVIGNYHTYPIYLVCPEHEPLLKRLGMVRWCALPLVPRLLSDALLASYATCAAQLRKHAESAHRAAVKELLRSERRMAEAEAEATRRAEDG